MAFVVVIDACALFPYSLRDSLLRLAEAEFFDLYWSEPILEEMGRSLLDRGVDEAAVRKVREAMTDAFEAAMVPREAIKHLEPSMPNNEKDRHVLAVAVAAGAQQIVTFNLKHFSEAEMFDIEAIHPDQFLLNQLGLDIALVLAILRHQANSFIDPPWDLEMLLDALRATVPDFVAEVEELVAAGE